ncbi:MAG TPA: SH3 domain-containing protein [Kofleriaceae bacterium]|nr:SH3 domain-containing protein [Kofleriaceae bacterium]
MRKLVFAFLIFASVNASADTPVWTTRDVNLRERPGETADVVAVADTGQKLVVIGRHGRWIHVRYHRRTGWVTRTEVETRADAPAAPKSGFAGDKVSDATKVTVTIGKVRGFDDPKTKATATLDLKRGDVVTVLGRGDDDWLLVESTAGDVGWIPAVTVTDGGPKGARFVTDPRSVKSDAVTSAVSAPAEVAEPPHAIGMMLAATAGAQTFAMRQTGGATGGDALATETGEAASVAAGARARITGNVWGGAGLDAELGAGDLIYQTASETSQPMQAKSIAIDARGELAFGPSWMIAARGGYHYGSLAITSDRTDAMLVGEHTGGFTVGVGGAVPLGRRAAIVAAIDVMPEGVQAPRALPAGILYGTSMRAAWAHTTLSVRLPSHLIAALSYRGGVAEISLTDGQPTPTTAKRSDQIHTITAGIGLSW